MEGGESQVPEVEQTKEMVKKRVMKEGPVLGETWRKVLSWNLNGVRSRLADGSFWRAIEGYDILCLSEFRCPRKTFLRKRDVRSKFEEMGYRYWGEHVTQGNAGYAGVVIISKVPFEYEERGVGDYELDKEGRLVLVDFGTFSLATGYFPNSGKRGNLVGMEKRVKFNRAVMATLKNIEKPFLLVGDLNVVGGQEGVEGGLQADHWADHPGCSSAERADFAELKRVNDLVDMQVESGVEGFSKVCGCNGRHDVRAMTIDFVLASRCLYEGGWLKDFRRVSHIATSDHLPQSFRVNSSLFPAPVRPILLSDVAKEHEGSYGSFMGVAGLVLQELGPKGSNFFLNEHAVGTDGDGAEVCAKLQDCVRRAWEFIQKWDPNETGVVSCEKINEMFSAEGKKDGQSTEKFVDICDAEILTSMENVERKYKPLKIQAEVSFGESRSMAMFDSGATRSLISKETLDRHLGSKVAREALCKKGYQPYFELADKSVVQSMGEVALQFEVSGKTFTHIFYVLKECSQELILGNDFMLAKKACLNYRTGELILYNEGGEEVITPFGLTEQCETPSLYSVLYARSDMTLPPFHFGGMEVECARRSGLRGRKVWGFCSVLQDCVLTPNGVADVDHGRGLAWVTNTSSKQVRVRKGDPVFLYGSR